jgi:hypothetical protein
LLTLLNQMKVGEKKRHKFLYEPLLEHFRFREDKTFTLTFEQIGKILGRGLCNSAYDHSAYWTTKGDYCISFCWLNNGYKIRKLHMDKKKVVFERDEDLGDSVKIPLYVFRHMPPNAKVEIDNMFKYIKEKYAL